MRSPYCDMSDTCSNYTDDMINCSNCMYMTKIEINDNKKIMFVKINNFKKKEKKDD